MQINGTTPAFMAAQNGHAEALKVLVVEGKCDPNKATVSWRGRGGGGEEAKPSALSSSPDPQQRDGGGGGYVCLCLCV